MNKAKTTRRDALKLIATTAAAVPVLGYAAEAEAGEGEGKRPSAAKQPPGPGQPQGTLTDPDLVNPVIPWEGVLDAGELQTLQALADVIIPRDEHSPGAGELGAQDYINEWVSAPYDAQKKDLIPIRGGIVWLNSEAQRRFGAPFAQLGGAGKRAICDDIRWEKTAKPRFKTPARFFAKVRDLCATAFYTTPEGMADIGYRGNTPQPAFTGPPPEALKHLGLAD